VTTLALDPSSAVPPFEQIRVQLTDLIRSGTIVAGTRLPTVRQLAGDLGVATNTVAKAYAALEVDGLVVANRRQGTTVSAQSARTDDQRRSAIVEATNRYVAELTRLGATVEDGLTALSGRRDPENDDRPQPEGWGLP
jgi:DNA-binding transcriptional regulator YhcF (GntR family)